MTAPHPLPSKWCAEGGSAIGKGCVVARAKGRWRRGRTTRWRDRRSQTAATDSVTSARCAEGGRAASLQAAQAPGTLSPVMGTIALRGMEYAEGVNFGCVASAAQQSV